MLSNLQKSFDDLLEIFFHSSFSASHDDDDDDDHHHHLALMMIYEMTLEISSIPRSNMLLGSMSKGQRSKVTWSISAFLH